MTNLYSSHCITHPRLKASILRNWITTIAAGLNQHNKGVALLWCGTNSYQVFARFEVWSLFETQTFRVFTISAFVGLFAVWLGYYGAAESRYHSVWRSEPS